MAAQARSAAWQADSMFQGVTTQTAELEPKVLPLGSLLTETPLTARKQMVWHLARALPARLHAADHVCWHASQALQVCPGGDLCGHKRRESAVCNTLVVALCTGCFRSGSFHSQRLVP